jgi:hypothetical protein
MNGSHFQQMAIGSSTLKQNLVIGAVATDKNLEQE